jgi:hypothetical protein
MRPRSTATSLLLLTCALLTPSGIAQTLPPAACPRLSVEQVVNDLVRKNQDRAHGLPAYRSTRTYRAEYRGFPGSRSAEMVVDVKYEPPGTKEFAVRSETGSKLIIDRVFKKLLESEKEAFEAENQKRTALNEENYAFTLLGCEIAPAGPMYVLAVEPRIKSKFLYRGKIWVDATDFAVARIAGEPAKNPSFWIRQTEIEQIYGKVNEFWLPARNHSVTTVRLGGHADFTIEYRDYQLTTSTRSASGNERAGGPR